MKLYDLRADFSIFCSFRYRAGENIHLWDDIFNGESRSQGYPVPKGERRDDDNIEGPLPDYTDFALGPYPTFSDRAKSVMSELLALYGEFAAIEMHEAMSYSAFNATTIVDVLDEEKSSIKRYTDGGVMRVEKHGLLEMVTTLPPIFKIPQTRRNTTYVNEAFVQRVQASGLQGFRFQLLFER